MTRRDHQAISLHHPSGFGDRHLLRLVLVQSAGRGPKVDIDEAQSGPRGVRGDQSKQWSRRGIFLIVQVSVEASAGNLLEERCGMDIPDDPQVVSEAQERQQQVIIISHIMRRRSGAFRAIRSCLCRISREPRHADRAVWLWPARRAEETRKFHGQKTKNNFTHEQAYLIIPAQPNS